MHCAADHAALQRFLFFILLICILKNRYNSKFTMRWQIPTAADSVGRRWWVVEHCRRSYINAGSNTFFDVHKYRVVKNDAFSAQDPDVVNKIAAEPQMRALLLVAPRRRLKVIRDTNRRRTAPESLRVANDDSAGVLQRAHAESRRPLDTVNGNV